MNVALREPAFRLGDLGFVGDQEAYGAVIGQLFEDAVYEGLGMMSIFWCFSLGNLPVHRRTVAWQPSASARVMQDWTRGGCAPHR